MAYRPQFTITAHLLTLVEELAALREKVLAATVQVPWIPVLQRDARVRNSHSSTAIEGNPLSEAEVRALEEGREVDTASSRSRREVLNYFAALRFVEKNQAKRPIADRDLLKLHSILAAGVMNQGSAGEFRKMRVRVGPHVPPEPGKVPGLMSELLNWWNTASLGWSAVVSSAIIHYRFEAIHPFADGNGRTGRMLALWELYRRGFDTHHIFSVDEFYWEDRERYYDALNAVAQQEGDLTGWLEYCASGLHLTLSRVWMRIQRLAVDAGPGQIVLRPRQEQLLQLLRDAKALAPREIREQLGVSKQGALDLLKPLIGAGLVRRIGTRKSGRYVLARP